MLVVVQTATSLKAHIIAVLLALYRRVGRKYLKSVTFLTLPSSSVNDVKSFISVLTLPKLRAGAFSKYRVDRKDYMWVLPPSITQILNAIGCTRREYRFPVQ